MLYCNWISARVRATGGPNRRADNSIRLLRARWSVDSGINECSTAWWENIRSLMRRLWHQEIHYETLSRGASTLLRPFPPGFILQRQNPHPSSNAIRGAAVALNRMHWLMEGLQISVSRKSCGNHSAMTDGFSTFRKAEGEKWSDTEMMNLKIIRRALASPTVRSSSSGSTGSVQPMEFRRAVTWPMLARGSTRTTCTWDTHE